MIETDSVRALSVCCTYMKAYHLTLQECIHLTKGLSIYLADDLKHLNDSQRFSTGELERFVVIILMMTMFASIIVLNC